jgi:hypothetical protein
MIYILIDRCFGLRRRIAYNCHAIGLGLHPMSEYTNDYAVGYAKPNYPVPAITNKRIRCLYWVAAQPLTAAVDFTDIGMLG